MDGPLDDTTPATRAITARDLLTFTFGFGVAMEMFTSPTGWPIVQAADVLHLSTIGPPNPEVQPDPDTPGLSDAERAMTSEQLTPAQKAQGGLGPDFFTRRSRAFGQSVLDSGGYGWDGGFGTSWLVDPTCDLTVIVLTQRRFETSQTPQVHREIQAAAYAAIS